jgi:hypothetical protein
VELLRTIAVVSLQAVREAASVELVVGTDRDVLATAHALLPHQQQSMPHATRNVKIKITIAEIAGREIFVILARVI